MGESTTDRTPWNDPLTRRPMCDNFGSGHNPHELMVVTCGSCRMRSESSRHELQGNGWRLFAEPCFHAVGDGFPVCPNCSTRDHCWEDLY